MLNFCKVLGFRYLKSTSNTSSSLPQTDEVIKRWRSILGPSKLFKNAFIINGPINDSDFVNLRQYFALSDTRNVGHGSDSVEELNKEIAIFENLMHDVNNLNFELFELNKFKVKPENESLEIVFKNILKVSGMIIDDKQSDQKQK